MKMKTEEIIKLIKYVTGSVAAVLLAVASKVMYIKQLKMRDLDQRI